MRSSPFCTLAAVLLLSSIPQDSATSRQTDNPHFHLLPFESLCLKSTDDGGIERSVSMSADGALRLSFRHSVYGSRVEELFLLRPGGFLLTQLRYGEARLAEFYGHEHAQRDNGVWIVTPEPMLLSSLNLQLSSDAVMSLSVDQNPHVATLIILPRGALRLTVAPCERSAHG